MIVFVPSALLITCWGGRTDGSSNSSSSAQFALLLFVSERNNNGDLVAGIGDLRRSDIWHFIRSVCGCDRDRDSAEYTMGRPMIKVDV